LSYSKYYFTLLSTVERFLEPDQNVRITTAYMLPLSDDVWELSSYSTTPSPSNCNHVPTIRSSNLFRLSTYGTLQMLFTYLLTCLYVANDGRHLSLFQSAPMSVAI